MFLFTTQSFKILCTYVRFRFVVCTPLCLLLRSARDFVKGLGGGGWQGHLSRINRSERDMNACNNWRLEYYIMSQIAHIIIEDVGFFCLGTGLLMSQTARKPGPVNVSSTPGCSLLDFLGTILDSFLFFSALIVRSATSRW